MENPAFIYSIICILVSLYYLFSVISNVKSRIEIAKVCTYIKAFCIFIATVFPELIKSLMLRALDSFIVFQFHFCEYLSQRDFAQFFFYLLFYLIRNFVFTSSVFSLKEYLRKKRYFLSIYRYCLIHIYVTLSSFFHFERRSYLIALFKTCKIREKNTIIHKTLSKYHDPTDLIMNSAFWRDSVWPKSAHLYITCIHMCGKVLTHLSSRYR